MSNEPIYKSAIWMLLALLSFTLMAVAVKELAHHLDTAEILFFRSLIGLLIIFFVLSVTGFNEIQSNNLKLHVVRNGAHFIGQYSWVYGIAFIPLAEVFAIEFTVPVWTAIIASILLNEVITKIRIISITLGLIGVLIILRPTISIIHPASLVVLFGAMAYGLSHTLTRSIVKQDSSLSVIFYMCLIQLPIGFVFMLDNWVMPVGIMWFWLLLIGITALTAHYGMSKALSYSDAMVVIPMDFLRLPIIMLVGLYFYNESIELLLLFGALIMLFGNYLNFKYERERIK